MKLAIQKNAQILAMFAVVCTAVVGITNELTKDSIKSQEQQQLLSTLTSIIPTNLHDNDMSQYCIKLDAPQLSTSETQTVYLAMLNGKPSGAAITSIAPDGYNGKINIISAFTIDGAVTGTRVLKHKETPGLGDKVELRKSPWITKFEGKTPSDIESPRWAVKKDGGMFDQFTGATITPRAVVKAVKQAGLYFKANKDTLFLQPNECGETK